MNPPTHDTQPRVYSVSELTGKIKQLLEDRFPFVWLTGEVSNCRRPGSGHCYFTLKDRSAQIQSVLFRTQANKLRFTLVDGLSVTGLGRVGVYEPRGTYQVVFEYLEPGGIGALQVAFEQLKNRLSAEGLFDDTHKRPLPFLPSKISLVTSPTGAVVHDMLQVIHRRFKNVHIEIVPVKVQGASAAGEIASALEFLNDRGGTDVIILARGGGSLEDLQAFNSEPVARAIFGSTLPVISAIGHETDYTIADFVSDLRAPTPSAAAEMVVPVQTDLLRRVHDLSAHLKQRMVALIATSRMQWEQLHRRLGNPRKHAQDLILRTDDLLARLCRATRREVNRNQDLFCLWNKRLINNNPVSYIYNLKQIVSKNETDLLDAVHRYHLLKSQQLRELTGRLRTLNPKAVLDRGYSITRTVPEAVVVRDPKQVEKGQQIEIMLKNGFIAAKVD